jgi:hypothetical protein
MTLKPDPGHNLSDAEIIQLEELIARAYPDEDVDVIIQDRPLPAAQTANVPARKPNFVQRIVVMLITVVAGIYLANPSAGVLEFIPDVIPVLGNLDEATAMALFISGLGYFGVNVGWLSSIFGRGLRKPKGE